MATKTSTTVEEPIRVERSPVPPVVPPDKPTGRNLTWLWLLILAALLYVGYRYFQQYQEKQRAALTTQSARSGPRTVPIAAVPARVGDLPVYLRGLGTVTAYNTVTVKSRVDGQLIAIHFQEGQFVKAGDLLAEIDPRPFQVQLDQAKGQLARDQAQLNDARTNLERYQALWQEKVIAKQQLDTQRATVEQNLGTIEADKAAINNAQLNLTYAKITAPISGRIGLRQVDVGNIVHASDPNGLVVIAQMQPIAVMVTIPADNLQRLLEKLRRGIRLRVDAYDRDDKTKIASGTALTLDNQIDPTTGTFRLKAEFANSDGLLFPNQFVNCRLLLESKHNVIIVPAPAIQRGPQGTYVYVVKPDKTAAIRPVTIGLTEGNDVVIDQGLSANEMVVIDGQDKLQEGSKVDVRAPGAGGGRGGAGRRGQGGDQGEMTPGPNGVMLRQEVNPSPDGQNAPIGRPMGGGPGGGRRRGGQ